MANNRIYLRCKGCGEELFLGKRFGDGYYWSNYGKANNERLKNDPTFKKQDDRPLEDRLNQFFDDHERCKGAGPDCFEISYEFPPPPLTNADHIRAMTDEELAKYLDGVCHDLWQMFVKDPQKMWLDWLKQEVENGEGNM